MNPDRHFLSHWDFYLDLVRGDMDDAESHRKFYDEYNAVLDMPAEYYLDTISTVFQADVGPPDPGQPSGRSFVYSQEP